MSKGEGTPASEPSGERSLDPGADPRLDPGADPGARARFGRFELDFVTGELREGGRPVRLQPQPTAVLTLLVRRAGELVTREELQDRVWGGDTVVAYDQGLNYCIRQVRSVLGDRAGSPTYIETVPRRGYRFVAPVERNGETEREGLPFRRSLRRLLVAAAVGAVVALVAFFALRGPSEADDPVPGRGEISAPGEAPGDRLRLAVLPFRDLGPEPDEGAGDPYLADSLTEELITHLSRMAPDRLGVISRVSVMTYRDSEKTVAQIGEELGVSHALEGSVRRAGGRLRVNVQLVETRDQTHLWAETYDRGFAEVLDIQSDIARRITRALSLRLLPERGDPLVRRTTADPQAYDAFLRGRYQWNRFTRDGYLAAVEHFRHALALDPEFAEAWAALADAYNLLVFTDALPREEAFERAREAARQGLGLDPELAEAHNSLAFVLLYHDRDPRSAVAEFERALELAPGYAMGHHWAAAAYAALGRFDDAIAAARRAVELDPVSLSVRADLGWYHLVAGHWDRALVECGRALELSPGYGFALACRERAFRELGDPQAALEVAERRLRRAAVDDEEVSRLVEGEASVALERIDRFRLEGQRRRAREGEPRPLGLAWAHAAVGELDEAFRWLEEALERREPWLVFLWVDLRFEPLWDDPRFAGVATRVGIPRPGIETSGRASSGGIRAPKKRSPGRSGRGSSRKGVR